MSRTLAEKITLIDLAFASIPHAFGGALALAYYAEPRATIDIDLNVFLPPARFSEAATALDAAGVDYDRAAAGAVVAHDGQIRIDWDGTPLDLFFAYDAFHDAAAKARRDVPFGDRTIPILSGEHLAVCKAVFGRPKDWVDIEAMISLGTHLDVGEVLRWVGRIAGDDDPRYDRMAAILESG